ncbi:MAG TPA: hypothetical protein VFG69_04420 [Nannocystaceae bacterium]|nr:hypothetical protein [Nannocystaceae bacterium]
MSAAPVPPVPPATEELRERVAALKHDLGKYVAWRSVNLPDDAWTGAPTDALVDALRADVLATRRVGDRDEAAWDVFAAHTAALPRPWPAPELAAVEAAVAALRTVESALRENDRDGIAAARPVIRAAQATIRRELATLHRRLLEER